MTDERNADSNTGVCIGRVRADNDVVNHGGVHIGQAGADGVIRDHEGVRIGTVRSR